LGLSLPRGCRVGAVLLEGQDAPRAGRLPFIGKRLKQQREVVVAPARGRSDAGTPKKRRMTSSVSGAANSAISSALPAGRMASMSPRAISRISGAILLTREGTKASSRGSRNRPCMVPSLLTAARVCRYGEEESTSRALWESGKRGWMVSAELYRSGRLSTSRTRA